MRKCRNWQTSKTKDLVIIAIVWVQVPSSALNNKTGTKQSVWSLSYCSKPKRALNPWFKVSAPLRSAQSRHPPDVLRPIFRMAPIVVGQVPMVQGLASGSVVAEQTSPRTSCNPSSTRLRLLRGRRPWVQGLRSASVGAEQTSPGCLAVSAPLRSLQNRRPPDVLQPIFRTPSSALKCGKLNYTDFVQNCILDQKERTSL